MAHVEQTKFCTSVKNKFPERFKNCEVLDIGSLDVNGNNRYLFEDYTYTGVDIGEGKNVDVISKGHEFHPDKQYDIVISTECFEHDKFWEETIKNCIELTKSNGLFMFTCASEGRPEHGTTRSKTEWASPYSHKQFDEYYKNLTQSDIMKVIDPQQLFTYYYFEYNPKFWDLYFWGIKK